MLKQLPEVTSQQLTPPLGAGGQLFWQSRSVEQLVVHV